MILFWLCATLLTLAAAAAIAFPLFETRRAKSDTAYALDVYRDQLAEVERDAQRGILSDDQARSAQLEIERRILALDDVPLDNRPASNRLAAPQAEQASGMGSAKMPGRRLIAVLAIALPLGGAALYLGLGQPQLPDQPFAARDGSNAPATPEILALRQKLAGSPGDKQAWLELGRRYLGERQPQAAAEAFNRAIALGLPDDASSAVAYADYGRALILMQNGQVSPDAEKVFAKVLTLDPSEPTARFFLALAKAQQGDLNAALTAWVALERDSPTDAPWRQSLAENIDKAARDLGKDPATLPGREPGHGAANQAASNMATANMPSSSIAGPSGEDMQAAAQMSPQDRAAFIQSMVDRLADRLKQEPGDLDGWMKLARAYTVLQQVPQAQQAWAKAAALAPSRLDVQLDYADALITGRGDDNLPQAFTETVARIRSLDAKNPLGLYYAGLVAKAAGRTDEARELWGRVLALLPEGSGQRAALQQEIDGLGGKPSN